MGTRLRMGTKVKNENLVEVIDISYFLMYCRCGSQVKNENQGSEWDLG